MGRTDFRKHVVLFFSPSELTLPTLLIKMSPWTAEEIASLSTYLAPPELDQKDRLVLMENPLDPSKSFLSDDFYSGNFPSDLAERMPVDFTPRTDDQPVLLPIPQAHPAHPARTRRTSWIRARPTC